MNIINILYIDLITIYYNYYLLKYIININIHLINCLSSFKEYIIKRYLKALF